MNAPAKPRKQAWTLILLFIIFAAPFCFAWYYVSTKDQREFRTVNHGDLIRPAKSIKTLSLADSATQQPFTLDSLKGKWLILYVAPDRCMEECHNNLYNIKQIITALGKKSDKVSSLLISLPDCQKQACSGGILELYPDMKQAELSLPIFEKTFAPYSLKVDREKVGEIYLCDPNGFLVMRYSGDAVHKDILKDLGRLLKFS